MSLTWSEVVMEDVSGDEDDDKLAYVKIEKEGEWISASCADGVEMKNEGFRVWILTSISLPSGNNVQRVVGPTCCLNLLSCVSSE